MTAEELNRAVKTANNPKFWLQCFGEDYLFQGEKEQSDGTGL